MRRLTCRSCGEKLSASEFDRRKAILRCKRCQTLIDLSRGSIPSEADVQEPLPKMGTIKPRAIAALPEGWTMERKGVHLRVTFWASDSEDKSGKAIILLPWFAALCLTLALFHLIVEPDTRSAIVLGIAAPICLAIMLFLRWRRRSLFLTTDCRHLWLDRWMTVEPLFRVPMTDIIQFYVAEECRPRNGPRGNRLGVDRMFKDYQLCVCLMTPDGLRALVIATFSSPGPALFLEQIFEEHLKIADRHIPGEIEAPEFAT